MKSFIYRLLSFLAGFMVINVLLGNALLLKKKKLIEKKLFFPAVTIADMYNLKKSADVFFLGSSRCQTSFDSYLLTKKSGLSCFNLGTSSQTPLTSYFILKEALKTNTPKRVFLELSYEVLVLQDQLINGGYLFDHMHTTQNKLIFFWEGFNYKEKVLLFVPSYRYRANLSYLFNPNRSASIKGEGDVYNGAGFLCDSKHFTTQDLLNKKKQPKWDFDPAKINPQHITYVSKIAELCQGQGIEFSCVLLPYPKFIFNDAKNYMAYRDFVSDVAARNHVPLYDLSQVPYLFNDTLDFKNDNHLNCEGAYKLSEKFNDDVLNRRREE